MEKFYYKRQKSKNTQVEFYEKIDKINENIYFYTPFAMFQILTGTENSILRQKSEEISSEEMLKYAQLGKQMLAYISDSKNQSVGLAAPQIGVNKRIIAVHLLQSYDDEAFRSLCLVNPKITYTSEKTYCDTEGCLSVPGAEWLVWRPEEIEVEYVTTKGKPMKMRAYGLCARILQHEIDHLDGILFIDKSTPTEIFI